LTLDIGYSDSPSLEPCDEFLNPLSKIKPPEELKQRVDELEKQVKK